MPPKTQKPCSVIPKIGGLTVQTREELADTVILASPNTMVPNLIPATPTTPAPTMTAKAPAAIPMDTLVPDASMEDLINRLINTTMTDNTTSQGIPDIVFQIRCDMEAHKVTADVTKGYSVIQGKDFIRKSVLQVNDISESRIKSVGCGYAGCVSTTEDALFELTGPILCYQCRTTNSIVDMTQGCAVRPTRTPNSQRLCLTPSPSLHSTTARSARH